EKCETLAAISLARLKQVPNRDRMGLSTSRDQNQPYQSIPELCHPEGSIKIVGCVRPCLVAPQKAITNWLDEMPRERWTQYADGGRST
ncbi:hypothetical protein PIB30_068332, partial [Stylosanthes scabra]|nr:hypothetical protein [Stylosanthes scabra]